MTAEQLLAGLCAVLILLLGVVSYFLKDYKRSFEASIARLSAILEEHSPKNLAEKLERITRTLDEHSPVSHAEQIRYLNNRYESLHLWKNTILQQQLETISGNSHQLLRDLEHKHGMRLDRLENKSFNGHK